MSLRLNGSWKNSYGSKMDLHVKNDGSIIGTYASSTGSTGTYLIIGSCLPEDPSATRGQGIALSIFWRSTTKEAADESWHWVSTYCGQLQADGVLSVINSLVATTEFSGIAIGDYIDKLAFSKVSDANNISDANNTAITLPDDYSRLDHDNGNEINGTWLSQTGQSRLTLSVSNKKYGLLQGTLLENGNTILLSGFSDTYQASDQLQSVSLSGYIADQALPISFSGQRDPATNQLQLSRWQANSTAPNESYLQASMSDWIFSKKI